MNNTRRPVRASTGFVLAVLASLLLAACGRVEKPLAEPEVRELRILEPYADGAERDPFAKPKPTLYDILEQVWDATNDANVRGLLLHVGPLGGAWGSVGDVTEALAGFRESGDEGEAQRPIHCHFETADNVTYVLLASSCDRISMTPAGVLDLVGPASVMIYAKSFLDKVGVQADILHMGRYKGAGDVFIRDDMPPEAKESMEAVLDDLYDLLVQATARRAGSDEKARAAIDAGPYVSAKAREAGLVDSVEFLRDARTSVEKAAGVEKVNRVRMSPQPRKLTLGQFFELFGDQDEEKPSKGERIALVFLNGAIVESNSVSMGDAPSGPFIHEMDRLAEDDDVKAVVLRINSPGGSALASDRMWEAARRVAEVKPLIASVGDVAASGGYYIASAADEIFAHPTSIVGSIGVVGGKFNFEPMASKLGVNTYVLQRGARAAWSTPVRGLNPTERDAFQGLLEDTYARFIDRVSVGRDMDRANVLAAAEGRVLTAIDAKELGLIDEMAGLGDALDKARETSSLGPDAPIEVWPSTQTIIDAVNDLLGGDGEGARTRAETWMLERAGLSAHADLAVWQRSLSVLADEQIALVPPFVFSVR